MKISYTYFTTVFIGVCSFVRTGLACDLDCGLGYRCQMVRSTCEYPPCPHFPTCVLSDISILANGGRDHVRPGQCPTGRGPCITTCRSDGDCPIDEKCCGTGCGHICRSVVDEITEKPGTCPSRLEAIMTHCQEECVVDTDCPGVTKCCKTACGATCSDPCYYWLQPNQRTGRKLAIWKLPFICRN